MKNKRNGSLDNVCVIRGGSWNNNTDNSRVSNRNNNTPDNEWNNNGFRLVLSFSSKMMDVNYEQNHFLFVYYKRRIGYPSGINKEVFGKKTDIFLKNASFIRLSYL